MLDAALSLCLLVASAGAVLHPSAPAAAPSATSEAEEATFERAMRAVEENDGARAAILLDELMARPEFERQPETLRYKTIALAGLLAQAQERKLDARRLLSKATTFDEAPLEIWHACADASLALSDSTEAGRCLAQSVRRWPDSASELNPYAVSEITTALAAADNTSGRMDLLESLFDAGWASDEKIIDFHWVRLVELLLADGRVDKAADVAARVDYPQSVILMRVDRRFDPIVQLRPDLLEVDAAIARNAARDDARVAAIPSKLAPLMLQQANRIEAHRFAEVLDSADRVIAAVRAGDGAQRYEDFDEMYPWILNQRAEALAGLGRWDDAIRALEQGARRPSDSGVNVNQTLNLADLLVRVGRAEDALAVVAEVGSMSPYGTMQREKVRLRAGLALGNEAMVSDALAYLRTHRDDAVDALQDALLAVGDLDAAAALLVERLHATDTRGSALMAVQRWTPAAVTRWDQRQARRWRRVLARPEVQAAVREVGRSERFALLPDFH